MIKNLDILKPKLPGGTMLKFWLYAHNIFAVIYALAILGMLACGVPSHIMFWVIGVCMIIMFILILIKNSYYYKAMRERE